MMIRSSSQITSTEEMILLSWRNQVDTLAMIKFFDDNPKAMKDLAKTIEDLSQKTASAFALTQKEKDDRQACIDDVIKANKDLKEIIAKCAQAKSDSDKVVKNAENEAKKTKQESDDYKAIAMKEVADSRQKIIDDKDELARQRDMLSDDLKKLGADQKIVADGLKKIEEWKVEKEAWEQDYTDRSTKLDGKLRKAVKG